MRGVAREAVQQFLGHPTMDMTMRHAHLSSGVKQDAVKLLDAPAKVANGSPTATEPARREPE